MKIIPKYFVGGVSVTTPILPSVAQAIEQQQTSARKDSDSESGSKKSYIEQIFDTKAKMLPSDAQALAALATSVGELEASPAFQNLSKPQQFAAIYRKYITMHSAATNAQEGWTEAQKHILNNGGSEEAAFTPDGYMFVHENGSQEISLINPNKFNRKQDIPVTNAELLYLRANDPKMAFNDKVLVSLTAATSMKEIRDMITQTVQKLGDLSTESEHYVNPRTASSKEALEELAKAHISQSDILNMDPDTLIKVKVKNKDNENQIKLIIKTVEAQLNPQQRALLQLRAKELGGKTTAESIITEYLYSMYKAEQSFTLDIDTTKTASGSSKSSKSGSEKEESLDSTTMPPVVEWMAGRGEVSMQRISNGSRGSLFAPANDMPITHGGHPSGTMNLFELATSDYAGALILENATVGGAVIPEMKRQHVLVDGNAIYNIPLPVDQEALDRNIIRPDFEAMDRFSAAWKELKSMGIDGSPTGDAEKDKINAAKINQVMQKYQLPGLYAGIRNGVPVLNLTNYRRFGVLNGYVDAAVLGNNATFNSALTKIEDDDADALLKLFKAHYKGYKGKEGFWSGPELYKAAIYIPIRKNYLNAYAGSGKGVNAGESADITRRIYDTEERQQNPREFQKETLLVNY